MAHNAADNGPADRIAHRRIMNRLARTRSHVTARLDWASLNATRNSKENDVACAVQRTGRDSTADIKDLNSTCEGIAVA